MLDGLNEDIALPLLTRRPEIKPSAKPVENLQGAVVMVTGAGGSIGSELCRQIAASSPAKLVMVDHSELNLYEVNATIDNAKLALERVAALADVRDQTCMRSLFLEHQPTVVFHAAALKHVPLLESDHNLIEAVRTNVMGTKIVLDLAVTFGAEFLLISTDKAVNPSSGMGLTKRVAEIYALAKSSRYPGARIAQVRFGNVVGSSGSVVPLFKRQIAQGGPVTVTHPEMTRYLMTIKEAVRLSLSACAMIRDYDGYSCFVLDMGTPVKIVDLAKQLIQMAGLEVADVGIEFVGVRPGEKLHEELAYFHEPLTGTPVEGVNHAEIDELNCPTAIEMQLLEQLFLSANARDATRLKSTLKKIVPGFQGEVTF